MKKETSQTGENLTEVTAPSGRKYVLQPLPRHFYVFFGELPSMLTNKAIDAIQKGDKETVQDEIVSAMEAGDVGKWLVMQREAFVHVCVNPRISVTPKTKYEISPLDVPNEDFDFITQWAFNSLGVEAQSAIKFR